MVRRKGEPFPGHARLARYLSDVLSLLRYKRHNLIWLLCEADSGWSIGARAGGVTANPDIRLGWTASRQGEGAATLRRAKSRYRSKSPNWIPVCARYVESCQPCP